VNDTVRPLAERATVMARELGRDCEFASWVLTPGEMERMELAARRFFFWDFRCSTDIKEA
jgi:hypothetical protein